MKGFPSKRFKFLIILLFLRTPHCFGYSALTHEALIDANWDSLLVPLIKHKFKTATPTEIMKARAFAYGGSLIPDIGFYPFGSKLFTNLVHYARSGDFVRELFEEAHNINEFAFALGVLCHYYGDAYGHPIGINAAVPLLYRNMKRRFGDTVTYAQNKISHLRTEFSFDVLQTACGNYASQAFHDFIGFRVSRELVENAFRKIYGLDIKDLFGDFNRALNTFKWSVQDLIPFLTTAAGKIKADDIRRSNVSDQESSYIFRINRDKSFSEFAGERAKAHTGALLISFIVRVAPKMGPLRILRFRVPGPRVEKFFARSFDSTALNYARGIAAIVNGDLEFANIDWDTGKTTMPGEYRLADRTYCDWVSSLKKKHFDSITLSAKKNILDFYKDHVSGIDAVRNAKIRRALEELKRKR